MLTSSTTKIFEILQNSRYIADGKLRVYLTQLNRFEACLITGRLGLLSDRISTFFRNITIVFQIQFYLCCSSVFMIYSGDLSDVSNVTR